MKAIAIVAFAAACAFAQPVNDPDGVRILASHGIKSGIELADADQKFQNAVAAIPAATTEMEQAVICAKQRPKGTCDTAFNAAVAKFQSARFDLRFRHYHAETVLHMTLLEIEAHELAINKANQLSPTEDIAVRLYLVETTERFDLSFAAAEKLWLKEWRRVGKVLYSRRYRRAHRERA
jgi:hypothetical protein